MADFEIRAYDPKTNLHMVLKGTAAEVEITDEHDALDWSDRRTLTLTHVSSLNMEQSSWEPAEGEPEDEPVEEKRWAILFKDGSKQVVRAYGIDVALDENGFGAIRTYDEFNHNEDYFDGTQVRGIVRLTDD